MVDVNIYKRGECMEEEKVYELIITPTQRWYPKSANVDLGTWQICSAKVVSNPKKEYID